MAKERQIHLDALLHGGIAEALRHPIPVGFVGDLLANLREVVLTIGIVDVREQLCALAHEMHPPLQEIPGGSHISGIDIGLGEHAAPE